MPNPPTTSTVSLVLLAMGTLILGACGGADGASDGRDSPQAVEAGGVAAAGADAPGLLKGTPPGGLREWIADVREGLLRDVQPLARTSPPKALERAVALYVSRQEYIEQYYEKGQPLYAGEELSTAVKDAESRFHELMQVLQRDPPDVDAVDEAVARLNAEYARVLSRAEASNARLSPRSGAARAEHRS